MRLGEDRILRLRRHGGCGHCESLLLHLFFVGSLPLLLTYLARIGKNEKIALSMNGMSTSEVVFEVDMGWRWRKCGQGRACSPRKGEAHFWCIGRGRSRAHKTVCLALNVVAREGTLIILVYSIYLRETVHCPYRWPWPLFDLHRLLSWPPSSPSPVHNSSRKPNK
jgi:hypothetical protein